MKKILFTLATLALLAGVTSCTKEREGKYNPKEKIQKVSSEWKYYMGDTIVSEMPKYVSEEWGWKDDQLERISYFEVSYYTSSEDPEDVQIEREMAFVQLFTYDDKGRLTKSEAVGMVNMEATCEYDGDYLKRMTIKEDGIDIVSYEFVHEGKKITSFKLFLNEDMFYSLDKKAARQLECVNPLRFVLAPEPAKMAAVATTECAKRAAKSGSKGGEALEFKVSWDGDNVSEMACSHMGGTMSFGFKYDTKNNPYYNLFEITNLENGGFMPFMPLNKNNVTMATQTITEIGETEPEVEQIEYTYTYNSKDYPTSKKELESYDDSRYEQTYYYEYK